MDQIDNQDLVCSLEALINTFQDEVGPYAVQLCIHITAAFFKYSSRFKEKNDENDSEDAEDIQQAATKCLQTLATILNSKNITQDSINKLEQVIIPIFNHGFLEDNCDFIDQILIILQTILYKSTVISENLWFYFPVLIYIIQGVPNHDKIIVSELNPNLNQDQVKLLDSAIEGWGEQFAHMTVGIFSNYIQKGGMKIFEYTDFIYKKNFFTLLFEVIDFIYQENSEPDQEDHLDEITMTKIYTVILENNKGKIDELLPLILQKAVIRFLFDG